MTDESGALSMTAEQSMRQKLMTALEPTRLDVINESEMHAGHRGSPGTGQSHFRLLIVSPKFTGLSRVARQRLVNEIVADDLKAGVHALAMATYAPGELSSRSIVRRAD
jgi:BolA family transcriptional regulator, general stress-responsive regulator